MDTKLHNYCLDSSIGINRNRFENDTQDIDEDYVILNQKLRDDEEEEHFYGRSNRRANFTDTLELKGVRRPVFAAVNSRA